MSSETPKYSEAVGHIVNAYIECVTARVEAVTRGETQSEEAIATHAKAARAFDNLLAHLDQGDDLLTFLDDSFSSDEEIRFVKAREWADNHRTDYKDGVTTIWVYDPPTINEFGDTEAPHETLSDALRAWYDRDAVKQNTLEGK